MVLVGDNAVRVTLRQLGLVGNFVLSKRDVLAIARAWRMLVCAVLTIFAAPIAALAQVPAGGLPGAVEPGRDRPSLVAPAQPDFDFRIEAPERSPVPRAVDEIRFNLVDLQIVGAVTFPPDRFRPLYDQLIGTDVSLSDILDVADAIETAYRDDGYLLVRAFVPPQRVTNGVFTINVVEGFVANVLIEGGDVGTRQRIRALQQPVLDSKPLRLAPMERALLIANDLPGVGVSGLLRPSPETQGASDLVVTVDQPRFLGGIAIDNRGSDYSGVWSFTGDVVLNSLLVDGDQIAGSVTTTTNATNFEHLAGQLRYLRPIGANGTVLTLFGTLTRGDPSSELKAFDVLTKSSAVDPRLSYPLLRSRAESIVVEGGLAFQAARVSILGEQFSHDEWRVADIGMSYLRNGFLGGNWAANIDFAQGLPLFGATKNGSPDLSREGARTSFSKLSGGVRFSRTIAGPFSIAAAGQGQVSFDPLVAGEQLVFGGAQIGRGYDPGAISGDHGIGGSLELRCDQRVAMSFILALQPYIFVDAASTWNEKSADDSAENINSIGGGVRFWLVHDIFGGLEAAHTLEAVPGSDDGKRATKLLVNLAARF